MNKIKHADKPEGKDKSEYQDKLNDLYNSKIPIYTMKTYDYRILPYDRSLQFIIDVAEILLDGKSLNELEKWIHDKETFLFYNKLKEYDSVDQYFIDLVKKIDKPFNLDSDYGLMEWYYELSCTRLQETQQTISNIPTYITKLESMIDKTNECDKKLYPFVMREFNAAQKILQKYVKENIKTMQYTLACLNIFTDYYEV